MIAPRRHLQAFKELWLGMFVILLFYIFFFSNSFMIVIVSKCENGYQNIVFHICSNRSEDPSINHPQIKAEDVSDGLLLILLILFLDQPSQHLTVSIFKQKSLSKVTPRRQGLTSAGLPPQLHHQPGSHDSPCITPYLWQPCAV